MPSALPTPPKKKTPDAVQGIEGLDQNTYEEDRSMKNATDTMAQTADNCSIPGCTGERHGIEEFDWHTASSEHSGDDGVWEVTVEFFDCEDDNVWRVYGSLKEHQQTGEPGGIWLEDMDAFTAAYHRALILVAELNVKLAAVIR
jgi:hypothetical protein